MPTRRSARLHDLVTGEGPAFPARTAAVALVIASIVLSVGAAMVETLPALGLGGRSAVRIAWLAALVVFAAEYVLRLRAAVAHGTRDGPRPGLLRYVLSPVGVADLLTVLLPALRLVGLAGDSAAQLGGLLALIKLVRYVPGLALVTAVLRAEARSLLGAISVLGVLLVLASGGMYVLEHAAQPRSFSSIPKALWWGIVTIASVGYGDMYPITPLGRLFGGLVILLGIAVFAVPAGILATGFAAELRKRDFVVTWETVAKVPLFAGLDATQIASIARLLRPQVVPARYVIVHRGDAADAMYFIVAGEVEVEVVPPVHLRAGQYFGEIGLLMDIERTATVTAVTEAQLLVLDVGDFRRLMRQYPDLEASIRKVAESRLQSGSGSKP